MPDAPAGRGQDEHWRAGCHGKRACPVRRGAVGKGPGHLAPRRRPTLLPVRFGPGAAEKDPHHGHLAGGLPVWIWGVLGKLEAAGLVTLADKGYQGSTYAKIPYKGKNKPESQKQANKAHAKLRSPGERANAQAQDLAHPPQAPLLPLARRPARQGHPRIADPRGITRGIIHSSHFRIFPLRNSDGRHDGKSSTIPQAKMNVS